MTSPSLETVRLFLHVIAAAVWVGGQVVLGALVPTIRRSAPDALKAVARAYARIAWPAFGVLVVTGLWNLMAIDVTALDTAQQVTVLVHVAIGLLSGMFAAVHSFGNSKAALAVGGALGLLSALGAMFVGVLASTPG